MRMTKEELAEVLRLLETDQAANLRNEDLSEADLSDADLSNADLSDADLRGADLSDADLQDADLSDADLSDADLRSARLLYANLSHASLRCADLRCTYLVAANLGHANLVLANLRAADLEQANLSHANLSNADLRDANLSGADLSNACLVGANLTGANLKDAELRDVIYNEDTAFFSLTCPEEGPFIGFKIAAGCVIKLEIPADANRSSATTRQCRCSKAKVLSITNIDGTPSGLKNVNSDLNKDLIYKVGEVAEVKNFNTNRWDDCGNGIYFYMSREEAIMCYATFTPNPGIAK